MGKRWKIKPKKIKLPTNFYKNGGEGDKSCNLFISPDSATKKKIEKLFCQLFSLLFILWALSLKLQIEKKYSASNEATILI